MTKQKGFTVIEILVVAPIIVLVVGAIIGVIIHMTGDVLATRAANVLTYNIQDATERIEQDTSRSAAFLATNNFPVVSPQGVNNDDTEFVNASAEGDALILNMNATTKNPSDPTTGFIYVDGQPEPCGSANISENGLLKFNVVYFVKDSTLWRRVVAPANYDTLGCQTSWQSPSCSPGASASICASNDVRLVDGVTDFSVDYYDSAASTEPNATASDPGATNAARAQALEGTATIKVNIEAGEAVAGRTVQGGAGVTTTSSNDDTSNALPTYAAPSVEQNPQDEFLVDGETANFSVATAGYPTPSVQWQESNNNGSSWVNIPGATNLALGLTNIPRSSDGYLYRAVLTSSEGSVNSQAARLNVGDSEWQSLNMINGWTRYTSSYNVSYMKTRSGVVVVRGMIKNPGTPSYNTAIANLPAGYRPSGRLIFPTLSGSGNAGVRLDVLENGDINFMNGSSAWQSLEGISFIPSDTGYDMNNISVANFANGWTNYGSSYAPAGYVVDNLGRVHLQGLVRDGNMANSSVVFSVLPSLAPSGYMHMPAVAGGNTYSLHGLRTGTGDMVVAKGTGSNGFYAIQSMHHPAGVGTWTNLSLQNGWVWYGGSFTTPQYTKDEDNIVKLKGLIKSGSTGTVIATLPVGYRPENYVLIRTISSNLPARVDINIGGEITIIEGSSGWLSLDGIQFVTNN